jgi:hypothetical protein
MWMMRPERRSRMPGSTARPSSTGLRTKKSSSATWSDHATSATGACGWGPVAFSTSTSTGPSRSRTAATSAATAASSVTSAANGSATPPSRRIASATSRAPPFSCRPLTATASPSRASLRAIAAPNPRELPVTRATRGIRRSVPA